MIIIGLQQRREKPQLHISSSLLIASHLIPKGPKWDLVVTQQWEEERNRKETEERASWRSLIEEQRSPTTIEPFPQNAFTISARYQARDWWLERQFRRQKTKADGRIQKMCTRKRQLCKNTELGNNTLRWERAAEQKAMEKEPTFGTLAKGGPSLQAMEKEPALWGS